MEDKNPKEIHLHIKTISYEGSQMVYINGQCVLDCGGERDGLNYQDILAVLEKRIPQLRCTSENYDPDH